MPKLGSVSHNTLQDEDLIDAFTEALKSCINETPRKRRDKDHKALVRRVIKTVRNRFESDTEIDSCMIEELREALETYAPSFTYFGTLEGNSSDFGFWPNTHEIECAIREGYLLKVDDLSEVPRKHRGSVLVVNDHGNMTLYFKTKRRFREEWAVV